MAENQKTSKEFVKKKELRRKGNKILNKIFLKSRKFKRKDADEKKKRRTTNYWLKIN